MLSEPRKSADEATTNSRLYIVSVTTGSERFFSADRKKILKDGVTNQNRHSTDTSDQYVSRARRAPALATTIFIPTTLRHPR